MNFLDNDCIHVPMFMQTSHNLQLPHPLELSVRMNLIFLQCVIVYMYIIYCFRCSGKRWHRCFSPWIRMWSSWRPAWDCGIIPTCTSNVFPWKRKQVTWLQFISRLLFYTLFGFASFCWIEIFKICNYKI